MLQEAIKPYVYKIIHKDTDEFYIGVRYSNKLHYSLDFGLKYFTSSKIVKKLGFSNFGVEWIEEFENKEMAYKFEQFMIKECWYDELCLNQNRFSGATRNFKFSKHYGKEHPCKGSRWITNGLTDIKIHDLTDFTMPEGFEFGRNEKEIVSGSLGQFWINDGHIEFLIKDLDTLKALSNFSLGRLPMKEEQRRILSTYTGETNSSYGSKWITNGESEMKVYPDENYVLPKGFIFGRLPPSKETKEKYKVAQAGENNAMFGRKWINNGIERKPIFIDDSFVMPNGWQFGKGKF